LTKLKRTLIKRDAPQENVKAINDRITLMMEKFNSITKTAMQD